MFPSMLLNLGSYRKTKNKIILSYILSLQSILCALSLHFMRRRAGFVVQTQFGVS